MALHDDPNDLAGVVGVPEQVEVVSAHHPLVEQEVPHPRDERRPERGAEEDDREVEDLPGLDQRQGFESSSSVPNPPGKMTNASAAFTNMALRA